MTDDERCAEHRRHQAIDAAFRAGDLTALRNAVENPSVIPNGPMPLAIGPCLEYAIYHSPIPFIRELLELGADTNPEHHAGFPPLIAAISCSSSQPGSPGRPDVVEIVRLLLEFGADPNQRGLNDWTPLHAAVAYRGLDTIPVLVAAGANPHLRTRIDDCATAREEAVRGAQPEYARVLADMEKKVTHA